MSRPLHVLIVEDSPDDAELVISELRRGGFDPVYERVDTNQTLAAALQRRSWDVIVSDYTMPGFTGLDALRLAHDRDPDVPFILISGMIGEDMAVKAMKAGAHDYLMKDNLVRLVVAIERELREAHTRRERRKAEQLLQGIVSFSSDPIISHNLNGIISSWNRSAELVFGYSEQEMIGQSFARLIPREHIKEETEFIAQVSNGSPVEHRETLRIAKDGRPIPVSLTVSPLKDNAGRIIGASKILRDISERKRAEESMRRLAAIVESSDDAIIGKDLDGIVNAWNPGAEKLYGYKHDEILGKPITILIPPDRHDEEAKILAKIRRGEPIHHFETIRMTKDGRRVTVSLTISPIKDGSGKLIGAAKIARDITERKKAEAALAAWQHELEVRVQERTLALTLAHQQLQTAMEEHRHLESEIARVIEREQLRLGHELHDGLGQELTGINYRLTALKMKLGQQSPVVTGDVEKLQALIQHTIEQTRHLARGFYPVEMETLGLLVALEIVSRDAWQRANISCVVESDKNPAYADLKGPVAVQLFRIVQEAVHNAVKHGQPNKIVIRLATIGDNLVVSVRDDGAGLPADAQNPKGMGLRIMHYRAETIGAKLYVGNDPGGGVVVTCSLPRIKLAPAPQPHPETPAFRLRNDMTSSGARAIG